jgi:hypothetical protein
MAVSESIPTGIMPSSVRPNLIVVNSRFKGFKGIIRELRQLTRIILATESD